jgi:hypothetical protein
MGINENGYSGNLLPAVKTNEQFMLERKRRQVKGISLPLYSSPPKYAPISLPRLTPHNTSISYSPKLTNRLSGGTLESFLEVLAVRHGT